MGQVEPGGPGGVGLGQTRSGRAGPGSAGPGRAGPGSARPKRPKMVRKVPTPAAPNRQFSEGEAGWSGRVGSGRVGPGRNFFIINSSYLGENKHFFFYAPCVKNA